MSVRRQVDGHCNGVRGARSFARALFPAFLLLCSCEAKTSTPSIESEVAHRDDAIADLVLDAPEHAVSADGARGEGVELPSATGIERAAGPALGDESSNAPSADTAHASAEEPRPRDLGAELKDAVDTPRECLADWQPASARTIRVSVSAMVRPSGEVTMASISGVGLSAQARQCIARRVEAIVLDPLGGPTSRRASTVLEIEWSPTPTTAPQSARAGAPDPTLRNVREPLPKRPEVAPSGRPIQAPTSRPIQEPTSRPIQESGSRRIRGPQPRPIDGWDVDESSKEWR